MGQESRTLDPYEGGPADRTAGERRLIGVEGTDDMHVNPAGANVDGRHSGTGAKPLQVGRHLFARLLEFTNARSAPIDGHKQRVFCVARKGCRAVAGEGDHDSKGRLMLDPKAGEGCWLPDRQPGLDPALAVGGWFLWSARLRLRADRVAHLDVEAPLGSGKAHAISPRVDDQSGKTLRFFSAASIWLRSAAVSPGHGGAACPAGADCAAKAAANRPSVAMMVK